MTRAKDMLEARRAIAARYDAAFSGAEFAPRLAIPPTGAGDARHLYPLRLRSSGGFAAMAEHRRAFAGKLQEQGIGVSVHFIPLHTMPYYRKQYDLRDGDCPEAMKMFEAEVSLPIWQGMSNALVERVIKAVQAAIGVN